MEKARLSGGRFAAEFGKKHGVPLLVIIGGSALFMGLFALLVRLLTGLPLSEFFPGYSDMAGYYIEINTAIEHGIFSGNAGYNGYIFEGNTLSVAGGLFYGAHGLFVLLPYILLGKLVGWGGASPLIIHLILLTAAFIVVYFCTESLKKAIAAQILTFCWLPFLLYFPTTMMEVQMYAWGIAAMALIWAQANRPNRRSKAGLLMVVVMASAAKITNIVFIIPYFAMTLYDFVKNRVGRKTAAKNLGHGLLALAVIALLFLVNARLSAPYTWNFISQLQLAFTENGGSMALFTEHFVGNLAAWFNPHTELIFVFCRYAIFGLAIFLALQGFSHIAGGGVQAAAQRGIQIEPLYLSAVLFSIMFLNILFYDVYDWRDFRVAAPVLLAVVLYIVFSCKKVPVAAGACVTLCILFLTHLHHLPTVIKEHFGALHNSDFARHIEYNAETNRYGNTVVMFEVDAHDKLDAGLGVVTNFGGITAGGMAGQGIGWVVTKPGSFEPGAYYAVFDEGENYIVYKLKQFSSGA